MEVAIVEVIGLENGVERKRISLMNPKKENVMAIAHSYYSKEQRKEAKANHKANL